VGYKPGPHRVEHDVAAYGAQISVFAHHLRVEAAFEHMAGAPVPTVESLAIHAVELSHGAREVGVGSFKQQMVVVRHKAVGMAEDVIARDDRREYEQETLAIDVVSEGGLASVAAGCDMIEPARELDAKRPSHVSTSRPE
jgi:hypothetical protein